MLTDEQLRPGESVRMRHAILLSLSFIMVHHFMQNSRSSKNTTPFTRRFVATHVPTRPMARTKRAKCISPKSEKSQITYPLRIIRHAAKLAQDFAEVYYHISHQAENEKWLRGFRRERYLKGSQPKIIQQRRQEKLSELDLRNDM